MSGVPSTGLFQSPPTHDYTSTACQHGFHNRCRLVCKFCAQKCECSCHGNK